jgi:hypothetical protein
MRGRMRLGGLGYEIENIMSDGTEYRYAGDDCHSISAILLQRF